MKFTQGDTYGPNECGKWTSGIHCQLGGKSYEGFWGNRVELYADSQEDAESLRDKILMCIENQPDEFWSY